MKKFDKSEIIPKEDIIVIMPNSKEMVSKKQTKEMLLLNSHKFKRVDETEDLAFQAFNKEIQHVYKCTYCHYGCRAKIAHMIDGSGRLLQPHIDDFHHLMDIQVERRRELRILIRKEVDINADITLQNMITKYIQHLKGVIDPLTPSKRYLSHVLTVTKLAKSGKITKTIDDIDMDKLCQSFPLFVRDKLNYVERNQSKLILVFFTDFQIGLMKNYPITLMGDGTYSYVPKMFRQLYTFHISYGSQAIPVMYFLT